MWQVCRCLRDAQSRHLASEVRTQQAAADETALPNLAYPPPLIWQVRTQPAADDETAHPNLAYYPP